MLKLSMLNHHSGGRFAAAWALGSIALCSTAVWAAGPRISLADRTRLTPPELIAPPKAEPIPPAVVMVSDSDTPQEMPVPAVGSIRSGVQQASTTQAVAPAPQTIPHNRYAPAAKSVDRYVPVAGAPATSGSAPGLTVAPATSAPPPRAAAGSAGELREPIVGQRELTPGSPTPEEVPLTLESNRLGSEAQPVPAKEASPLASDGGARSVLSNSPAVPAAPAALGPTEGTPAVATPAEDAPIPGAGVSIVVATPAQAEPVKVARTEIAPSTFREVEPGVTTLEQVIAAWGEPVEQAGQEGEVALLYKIEPFSAVQVQTSEKVVQSILIQLDGALAPDALAERLQLGFIRTVEVRDAHGAALGRAFPERGVLFSYDPKSAEPIVAQVLLETIDPQAFYLRAETFWRSQAAASLEDLNYVIERQPTDATAQHLLARIHLSLDHIDQALAAADKARELDPEESEYRLTRAECLSHLGKAQEAEQEAAAVRAANGVTTLAKSRSLLISGDLLAHGTRRDFKAAIALHMEAIKLAEPLAADPLVATRRKAKEVLIAATLAVARDIAWGNWNRKEEVVPKWIERADTYARDAMAHDGAGAELRVMVIERALAAHAGFKPAVDPARFLEVAAGLTADLSNSTDDPLAQQTAEWELGRIYNHAVRLAHLRSTVDEGLKYGAIAQEKLENAAAGRGSSLLARNELGRLYFHVGVLHAVHKQNHDQAVQWYDRAHDLLAAEDNIETEDPGQLGEMLVSMGVSYWQVDLKQKALELTTLGTRLVKQAVEQGTLAADSLQVPYGNLASMHDELGQSDKAREIELNARQLQQTQLK